MTFHWSIHKAYLFCWDSVVQLKKRIFNRRLLVIELTIHFFNRYYYVFLDRFWQSFVVSCFESNCCILGFWFQKCYCISLFLLLPEFSLFVFLLLDHSFHCLNDLAEQLPLFVVDKGSVHWLIEEKLDRELLIFQINVVLFWKICDVFVHWNQLLFLWRRWRGGVRLCYILESELLWGVVQRI